MMRKEEANTSSVRLNMIGHHVLSSKQSNRSLTTWHRHYCHIVSNHHRSPEKGCWLCQMVDYQRSTTAANQSNHQPHNCKALFVGKK